MVKRKLTSDDKRFCACGCGTLISAYVWRRPKFYEWGHNRRGQKHPNYIPKRMEQHYRWKGGCMSSKNGYVLVRREGDPRAYERGHYRLQHIVVYEQYYKCCLLSWAVVHHRDENRQNNAIKNLVGMTRAQHTKLHKLWIKAWIAGYNRCLLNSN